MALGARHAYDAIEVSRPTMSEKKPSPPRQEEEAVQFGDELPVLPIRNAVLFPGAVAPFDVGREKSVALVEDVDNMSTPVIAIFRSTRSVDRRSGSRGPSPGGMCGAGAEGAKA